MKTPHEIYEDSDIDDEVAPSIPGNLLKAVLIGLVITCLLIYAGLKVFGS